MKQHKIIRPTQEELYEQRNNYLLLKRIGKSGYEFNFSMIEWLDEYESELMGQLEKDIYLCSIAVMAALTKEYSVVTKIISIPDHYSPILWDRITGKYKEREAFYKRINDCIRDAFAELWNGAEETDRFLDSKYGENLFLLTKGVPEKTLEQLYMHSMIDLLTEQDHTIAAYDIPIEQLHCCSWEERTKLLEQEKPAFKFGLDAVHPLIWISPDMDKITEEEIVQRVKEAVEEQGKIFDGLIEL